MADRSLHIGVDGRELVGHPTGVGRYVGEVLREWARDTSHHHRISVFVPGPVGTALRADLGSRVTWIDLPAPRGGTWWEQVQLPGALRRAGVDVLFAGAYTAPLFAPCPVVVVIHDVSFTAHPEWFSRREGARRRWFTRRTARRAARIVTVSEFSASEIVRHLGVPRGAISLASPATSQPAAQPPRTAPRPPVVLYVGSLFNRRLVPELIEAFSHVATRVPEATLVLVGDNRTEPHVDPRDIAQSLGIGSQVTWREYVSEEELAAHYASARVFAFLSTYEGFGMTPLEAISHGVPAVLLDTPVAREIYGPGARLVTAAPASIAAALHDLLTNDDAHAAQLAAGRPLLEKYSWAATATTIRVALEQSARPVR